MLIPDPSPLPRAGLLEALVFDHTTISVAALAIMGVIVLWVFNGKGQLSKGLLPGLALLGLAGAVLAAAAWVPTDRKAMMASTRELVRSVAQADGSGLNAELADDAEMRAWLFPGGIPKDRIVREVEQRLGPSGQYQVRRHDVLELQSAKDGPEVGRVQVKVRVYPKGSEFAHLSWWRMDYRKVGEAWKVRRIEPLAVQWIGDVRGR